MDCTVCQNSNSPEARFCIECGSSLGRTCNECGSAVPPRARFCPGCGGAISAVPAPVDDGRAVAVDGERRYLTAMFCDLVNSTELSQRMDPEELRVVVRAYQTRCAGIITSLEGTVAQYLGDGLLVYFGYPQAHEDDPVRAIRAAVAIFAALPDLNAQLSASHPALVSQPFDLRIGIHTGEAVVAEMGGGSDHERLAVGDTINIAARIQGAAAPGTIVVSEATRRQGANSFDFEEIGETRLRGVKYPIRISRVRGSRDAADSVEGDKTPFVGREQEVTLLLDHWEQAREGAGGVVLVSGDPGMGKSRLMREFRKQLSDESHIWLEGQCSPYHENRAFYPLLRMLQQAFAFAPSDSGEQRLEKLERSLDELGFRSDEVVAIFGGLLSLPIPQHYPALSPSPDYQRKRTLEFLAAWVFRVAEQRPVVLLFEDLHWLDPSTGELLTLLLDQVSASRVLLVLAFRPSFEQPWSGRTPLLHLTLPPLTRSQMGEMVESIGGGRPWPSELIRELISNADGVPLFIEELSKAVLESELVEVGDAGYALTRPLGALAIPTTLQGSLLARLDHLGSAKETAQLAAVIGRDFSFELLEAFSPLDAKQLEDRLATLVESGLLYRRGVAPDSRYSFKHSLVQSTAYQSLMKSARRKYHGQIGEILERDFPDRVAGDPELAAHHFHKARVAERASFYSQRAAERAVLHSANAEAIRHLLHALEALEQMSPSAERDDRELTLSSTLGVLLMAAKGAGDPEVGRVFERMSDLSRRLEPTPRLGQGLFGLSVYHQARGELDEAIEIGERLFALAHEFDDSALLVSAHLSRGIPRFWRSEPAAALEALELAAELYDPTKHRALGFVYGQDPGVSARSYCALALWQLGYPDRAIRVAREAIELGTEDLTLAFAMGWTAWVHQVRGEPDSVLELCDQLIELSNHRGYVLWRQVGGALRSWALAVGSDPERGLAELREAMQGVTRSGTDIAELVMVGLSIDAQRAGGDAASALALVDTALANGGDTHPMVWDFYRVKGELLAELGGGADGEAERLLRTSLAGARDRGMRSYVLRASTSLARLLAARGETEAARELVSPVYAEFDEGFETADLVRARALLAELA